MTMPTRPRTPRRRTRSIAAASIALSILATGCERADPLADVVEEAGVNLAAISGNGVSMPPVEVREQTYNRVMLSHLEDQGLATTTVDPCPTTTTEGNDNY